MSTMKSTLKRVTAIFLAALMVLALSLTAFAAGDGADGTAGTTATTGTLTVKVADGNSLNGQTIFLYKLFDVTTAQVGEKDTPVTSYSYAVNTKYKEKLQTVLNATFKGTAGYKELDGTSTDADYFKAIKDLENTTGGVQKFANDFTAALLTANSKIDADKSSPKLADKKGDDGSVTPVTSYEFTDTDYGYYLVYQTGTKELQSSLLTFDSKTAEAILKGKAPSIEKTAKNDKDEDSKGFGVEIGKVVTYTIKGTIPDTTGYTEYVYKIGDTLSDGLDFVADATGAALTDATKVNVDVKIGDAAAKSIEATLSGTNNRTMELTLSDWVRNNQTSKGKEFTVTYYAKVNKGAVVETKNSATLTYGNDPQSTTTTKPSEVKTPTYPLDIKKTDNAANEADKKILAGATFRLYRTEDAAKNYTNTDNDKFAVKVTKSADGSYTVAEDSTATDAVMEFVSASATIGTTGANLHLNGLAAGTYYLVETKAPDGYNKLSAPVTIVITEAAKDKEVTEWTISKDGTDEADKIIDIENSTGTQLPSTGGSGTVIFTAAAVVMILGVGVSFVRSRKHEG